MTILSKSEPWPTIPSQYVGIAFIPERKKSFSEVVCAGIAKFSTETKAYPTKLTIGVEAFSQMRIDQQITCGEYESFAGIPVTLSRDAGIEIE